jgi:hypothetical protein
MNGLDVGLGLSAFAIMHNEKSSNFIMTTGVQPTTSIRVSSVARPMMIVGEGKGVGIRFGSKDWDRTQGSASVACRGKMQCVNVIRNCLLLKSVQIWKANDSQQGYLTAS